MMSRSEMSRSRLSRYAAAVLVALALMMTVSAGAGAQDGGVPSVATPPAATQSAPEDAGAEKLKAFQDWLKGVREEGLRLGISAATLDSALAGLIPIARVIQLDRRQPEFTQTFRAYIDARVSSWRVNTGRERLRQHGDILKQISAKYGVQPRFIVALWGLETSFGRATGGFPVVQALATLAFDGRRADYFRRELFNAMKIIDAGHVSAAGMKGSWAGAMGQNQFMPSSFLSYAVDHNGDGRRDIWGTTADVFASSANYLKQSGWRDDQTWGREVRLPDGFADRLPELMPKSPPRGCRDLRKLSVEKNLVEWSKLGVRAADGGPLPKRALKASLALPEGPEGPALLVYGNFRATMRWNCSVLFATAVGMLADRLR
jgi:membrane-bound lytic murein transglycosylase B